MTLKLAPIILFVYNRLWHTEQTILSLQKNELAYDSDLIIYSDGPKNDEDKHRVNEVRKYIHSIDGFKNISIIERERNYGLATSIISGVTEIINHHGSAIIIEDDMVTSRFLLKYLNDGLNIYSNIEEVISIHGYIYPVKEVNSDTFFLRGADCWGWATWKRGWDLFNPDGSELLTELKKNKLEMEFDFNNSYPYTKMLSGQTKGKNDSWAVRWYASAFLNNKLSLYPSKSLVHNTGCDGSGHHCKTYSDDYASSLNDEPIEIKKIPVEDNIFMRKQFENYFKSINKPPGIIKRLLNKIDL